MNHPNLETLSSSSIPEKVKGVPWQEFETGLVLLQTKQNMVHELNETAAWLWMQTDGIQNIEQLASHLTDEFEVEAETAREDILLAVQDFISKGLMKWK